jgi:preprotein translocase subunit SecA
MFGWILKKIMGTQHERQVKKMRPRVTAINALEPTVRDLSNEDLRAKTAEFRQRIANGQPLDEILHEAFAVGREAGRRFLEMRHFDVQLLGGMVLHKGSIAEMKTGEGKTLVATLPIYLNALEGKGVHLVTVNDYLARRDAEWMGRIYKGLGLSVGVILHAQRSGEKRIAYDSDVTYGQNNEFGFDYLRDNMKFSVYDWVQRDLNYAIVDEVDSILVDEARTPLIISGTAEESSELYRTINAIVPSLRRDQHYTVDEKGHNVMLTDEGVEAAQRKLGVGNLFDPSNIEYLHILTQSLKAHTLYKRDVNYMVTEDGRVLIIDEFTGRVLPGRRWSDGLHQAVEAKENVRVQEESRTLATITFQNLFRLYKKLAGMTGTADTEAEEFDKTYKLEVCVIPTNKTNIRKDAEDVVYKTEREKFRAIANEIEECRKNGQPTLLGTASVEKSEAISKVLTKRNIPHEVLNAKQHEREAYVIAQAGRKAAVTVATNMAGRGTDIILGGNPEMLARAEVGPQDENPEAFAAAVVKYKAVQAEERDVVVEAGGLHIIGTERHESRRIDNQLRGRGGRQGDPGSSRFYLSLEDDLMRIFAADRISKLMERLGMEDDVPIEHPWVTKAVENAQGKVEARNFDIRKNLLEYDDVMNQQRKTIYSLRKSVLEGRYEGAAPLESEAPKAKKGDGAKRIAIDERLAKRVPPILETMVKHFANMGDGEGSPYRDAPKNEIPIEKFESVDVEKLEREVYHYFGVRVPLQRFAKDARGALDSLNAEVPQALSEQRERFLDLCDADIGMLIDQHCPEKASPDDWDFPALEEALQQQFNMKFGGLVKLPGREAVAARVFEDVERFLERRESEMTPELSLRIFRHLYLEEIDKQWIDHLQNMDSLRDGIGLRGYGQKDPKLEYKKEGYDMFLEMLGNIESNVLSKHFRVKVQAETEAKLPAHKERQMTEGRGAVGIAGGAPSRSAATPPPSASAMRRAGAARPAQPVQKVETFRREHPKVGRNDPCPCGSGKKYKKCHGTESAAGTPAT